MKQGEDSLNALEDAAQHNNVEYIHKIAKMLIHQPEGQDAVNDKLRDLGEIVANVTQDTSKEVCIDLLPGEVESSELLKVVGYTPQQKVKDTEELPSRLTTLTPSQQTAFKLISDTSKQQPLFVTGPGGTGKSYLIHTSGTSHTQAR